MLLAIACAASGLIVHDLAEIDPVAQKMEQRATAEWLAAGRFARSGRAVLRDNALALIWALRGRSGNEAPLAPRDWGCVALVVLAGGVAGPLLLMIGLVSTPASSAALLLNLEGSGDNGDCLGGVPRKCRSSAAVRRFAILAGAVLLSWQAPAADWDGVRSPSPGPALPGG